MTATEALKRARLAFPIDRTTSRLEAVREGRTCKVLKIVTCGVFPLREILATGPTWEALFEEIEYRKAYRACWDDALDQPCPECFRTMRAYGTTRDRRHPAPERQEDGTFIAVCDPCHRTKIGHALHAWAQALAQRV